jgi:hypothetical protein
MMAETKLIKPWFGKRVGPLMAQRLRELLRPFQI